MLPNFLIIGAEKAATSWLAACLGEHPQIFVASVKETYFFTMHYSQGPAWYESFFENGYKQRAIGEATPGYLSHPDVPSRIRNLLGEIPLIASLRHPVDRAYSAFWHYMRQGRIPADADFVRWLREEEDPCWIRTRGFYGQQLQRYRAVFPEECVLVLLYEEMMSEPLAAVHQCLRFLGVDTPDFQPKHLSVRVNRARNVGALNDAGWSLRKSLRRAWDLAGADRLVPGRAREAIFGLARRSVQKVTSDWGPTSAEYSPLDPGLRQELLNLIYADDIRELEDLLGRDLSCWMETQTPESAHVIGRLKLAES